MAKVLLLAGVVLLSLASVTAGQEKTDPEYWIGEAEAILARTESYTAIFHKQEWVKGRLKEKETVYLKFKKPFRVYMKWVEEPGKGREVLYGEGWNNNRILVRENGMMGLVTLKLDPLGSLAMNGSRHPITEAGLNHLVSLLGRNLRLGLNAGELEFRDYGEERMYGLRTQKCEVLFPQDKMKGYYCNRVIMNLGITWKLPIRVQIYDWENRLVEDYGFENLRLDAGLADADFDPKNPEYRFH